MSIKTRELPHTFSFIPTLVLIHSQEQTDKDNRMTSVTITVLLIASFIVIGYGCTLEMDAELAKTHGGTVMHRSAASNLQSVYFTKVGQWIEWTFSTTSLASMTIRNVLHANDGGVDVLDVSVDENSVGQFSTRGRSGGGHLWNVILQSGHVGNAVSITEGLHKVKVEVQSTDRYGVEIDQIILEFNTTATECPRSVTGSEADGNELKTTSLSAGAIVGIIFAAICFIGIVAGVVAAIMGAFDCLD